jgi:hypothetical protein
MPNSGRQESIGGRQALERNLQGSRRSDPCHGCFCGEVAGRALSGGQAIEPVPEDLYAYLWPMGWSGADKGGEVLLAARWTETFRNRLTLVGCTRIVTFGFGKYRPGRGVGRRPGRWPEFRCAETLDIPWLGRYSYLRLRENRPGRGIEGDPHVDLGFDASKPLTKPVKPVILCFRG